MIPTLLPIPAGLNDPILVTNLFSSYVRSAWRSPAGYQHGDRLAILDSPPLAAADFGR
jgi:hypothetical protein